ncbi:uncharacterized protein LOC115456044 isoform X1 [Manduca sexta]|uniref:Phospholipase A2 n=2 Tax=Manduca sexta TaxID=7130 RepID=A0A921YRY1_MANSE|nr:uncharacterized protein LOC115456044 isoform X1 [Manduca sexta]KAG6443679.1 hypothetical protein O3G_MSEX002942 [Manduca sexta]
MRSVFVIFCSKNVMNYAKMYHPVRKKLYKILASIILLTLVIYTLPIHTKTVKKTEKPIPIAEELVDNNIIEFDEDYSTKFNKKYGTVPWHDESYDKETLKYTVIKENKDNNDDTNVQMIDETTTQDYSVIPLELISTTQDALISIIESTTEPDLSVIPLSTTHKVPKIEIKQTVTLPTSTENAETTTDFTTTVSVEEKFDQKYTVIPLDRNKTNETDILSVKAIKRETTTVLITENTATEKTTTIDSISLETTTTEVKNTTRGKFAKLRSKIDNESIEILNNTNIQTNESVISFNTNSTQNRANNSRADFSSTERDEDVPIYTELDTEDQIDVPEDYYDTKDVVPTTAPRNDAISVIFGLAGSVVESVVETVAERVVPKSIYDLFKRMQRQNEALEAERLRSREENGGIGQFTRGIIKSISTGIYRPLSQLMAGVRDIGSLDTDRGFVSSLASGVTSVANVANSVVDAFKDRVQAIYPGTVWCGDGRSATARSSDLGLFFFTDTCCRQHDACKLYIKAGETKYGLTNTGLFTRSHCSCDMKFRECLRRTNSLVSAQIGLTYFNVLGPQCFRRAHPIVRCVRRTRITGQKCEEYELDYTKPRMWQWFDNETF